MLRLCICSRHRAKYRKWNNKNIKVLYYILKFSYSKSDIQPDDGYICIVETCSFFYICDTICVLTINPFFINAFKILEGRSKEKRLRDTIVYRIA